MPPGDRIDTFRRLLGSAKVGHVKITDEMSQVGSYLRDMYFVGEYQSFFLAYPRRLCAGAATEQIDRS